MLSIRWLAAALLFACLATNPAQADDLTVNANKLSVTVSALGEATLRVRIAPQGNLPEDASWAVPAAARAARAKASISATSLTTARLRAVVDPATLALRVEDLAGHAILSDAALPFQRDGTQFTLRKALALGEHIYGLGDKTGGLDRRGKAYVGWNTDSYGFKSHDDPIYKTIPFFISSGGDGGAYGVLLDNSFRSWFDFGQRQDDVIAFGAEDGPIDYYIIAGPTLPDVVRRYTDLTGKAPLPPRWALGYQQSRWSYMSETEVRDLATRLRGEAVPTDVIWLDIDFQDRNRPFTIDRKAFPHFREMVHDLDAQGIKTVTITDLHIAVAPDQGYKPYDEGMKTGMFLKNADGSTYVAPVWPGPSVFPDFTREPVRKWWGGLFANLLDDGVAGIWNDMNEPAIFLSPTKTMPLTVQHRIASDDFTPRTASHRELHNVYGMENTRATYEGLRALRPEERAFVMTRASYAGGQRYAVTWTGDNTSSWDHLKLAVAQTLNLGLSGFSWTGADVGGFTGGPSPELLTRWFQYAAFAPIFRDHSQKDVPRAEPWVHGPEQLAIRRRYVEERYRLLPFLYSLAESNARNGDPMMRPILYDYPDIAKVDCDTSMQFTLGGVLLIAGAPKPESPASYKGCLPVGGWYDYWTGKRVSGQIAEGGRMELIELTPRLEELPVFVRAGAVIPRQPLVQSTSQHPDGPLELHIYPGAGCNGEVYDDDGHSMAYARGDFLRQRISCVASAKGLSSISISPREGNREPWWKTVRVVIHGVLRYSVSLNGKMLKSVASDDGTRFELAHDPRGQTVQLQIEMTAASTPIARWRLLLFASGDLAFNLYWQSVMLYLLYYYTEAIHLSLKTAALCYALASVWDGIINLAVGILAHRYAQPDQFRRALLWGALPLGASFCLAYAPPPVLSGWIVLAWVLGGHLLFRTLYALVNIPYLAMSARISLDTADRALVAGGRMVCGTVAAVIIALGTIPFGSWLSGSNGPQAYAGAAVGFALSASIILMLVGLTYRDAALPAPREQGAIWPAIVDAVRNRAFVTICGAVLAMMAAVTVFDKSVLYYFKYALGDEQAGQLTLGWMMGISGIAIPLWVMAARRIGARGVWFAATFVCLGCLTCFILARLVQPLAVQIFLVAIQTAIVGLHFAFWALLPDTVEYGQQSSGQRAEAVLYGLAALTQRLAIGLGTLLVGFGLGGDGLHHAAVDDGIYRLVLAGAPMLLFAVAGVIMLANPLRRGSHARIVAELAETDRAINASD